MEVVTREIHAPQKLTPRKKITRALIIVGAGALIATKLYMLFFYLDPILGIYSFLTTFLVFSCFIVSYTMYKDPFYGKKGQENSSNNKNGSGAPFSAREPLVSVIVPAKNDPVMIIEAAKSCLASTYRNIEVIMVNDGSTDDTGQAMDLLRKEFPDKISVIHLAQNVGKRKAVREGIVAGPAKGDIILLIDSDCVIEKTAIERMVKVFDDPDVGAVSGHGRAVNADQNTLTKMQDTWYDGQFSIMKAMESAFGTVTCCPGILSAYRKEAIMPALDKWANDVFLGADFVLGDDRHLTSYVIGGNKHYIDKEQKVWKAKYCESAIVYTEVPHRFKKFMWQQIRWKKSWLRVFFFTAPYYYKDRNAFAAAVYYLQMIWSFLSPVVAIRSLILLPLQGEYWSGVVYIAGLLFIGLLFAAEFKMRNPASGGKWAYRLTWSVMGFFLSSLEYYSFLTVRNKSWLTR
ncbi:glycosyltransferase family 2 protein [Nitrososphaera viennensis]|uniref:Glycosyltransferase family 2 protein n=2 Tax=Nitrososphaera viennensis TaxID=1034015 RepID=A0A977IG65_9ARCH|nr:glycosyltransferase [Nitrososphaera viennensis]AIC15272.1 putative Glycosyl transferase, family 2 [Nitrososphaera viennensis EN76]UVS70182.1 glycosyltransferase family 2 protein [Nitrososphaera viennensis]